MSHIIMMILISVYTLFERRHIVLTSGYFDYQILRIDAERSDFTSHERFAQCLFRFCASVRRFQGSALGLILVEDQIHARNHSVLFVVSARENNDTLKQRTLTLHSTFVVLQLTFVARRVGLDNNPGVSQTLVRNCLIYCSK